MSKKICIAGKGWVACNALRFLVEGKALDKKLIRVIPVRADDGVPSWMPSLRKLALDMGVECWELEDAYKEDNLSFVSLEYDRIIHVDQFKSSRLFNIHFSKLPAYRGVGMAMLPILYGESETAVTLHYMDDGIDTGPIIAQKVFKINDEWDCRDLYVNFHQQAFELFKECYDALFNDNLPKAWSQPIRGASYFSRKDIKYGEDLLNLTATAWQAYNSIRAAIFWEYQLPKIRARKCIRAILTNQRSRHKPGTIIENGAYEAILSTIDYDVILKYSVYDDLYEWASGRTQELNDEVWVKIDDIDRKDSHGWTASMMAAYNNRFDCLKKLLECGADVNATNYKGTTLLMFAKDGALNSHDPRCVKTLLAYGADVLCRDWKGKSILDYLVDDPRPGAKEILALMSRR